MAGSAAHRGRAARRRLSAAWRVRVRACPAPACRVARVPRLYGRFAFCQWARSGLRVSCALCVARVSVCVPHPSRVFVVKTERSEDTKMLAARPVRVIASCRRFSSLTPPLVDVRCFHERRHGSEAERVRTMATELESVTEKLDELVKLYRI